MTKKLTDERVQQLITLNEQGFNLSQLSEKLDISKETLSRKLKSLGITPNYHRGVSDAQIINLNTQGLSMGQISEKLGIAYSSCVQRIHKLGLTPNYTQIPGGLQVVGNVGQCVVCKILKEVNNFRYHKKLHMYDTTCKSCRNIKSQHLKNCDIIVYLSGTRNSIQSRHPQQEFTKYDLLEIYENQDGSCFYTGGELVWGAGSGKCKNALSVDKVIPSKGYIKGNIVLCCNWINIMKSDASLDTLKIWMPLVYEKIQQGYKDGILY